jgi:hypothetical protein
MIDPTRQPLTVDDGPLDLEPPDDELQEWVSGGGLDDVVDGLIAAKDVQEASYAEELHPRGRGGKWIRKLGGPAREMSGDEWADFKDRARADPFSHVHPGDDADPIVNALHQIDSGWTMKMSKNRDELPTGSLPFGVEGVTRFDKQVGPGETPDSLVLHMRQKEGGGLEVINAGHGSMVWDHMIATPEMRADEERVWKEGQAQIAAQQAERERERDEQGRKQAQTIAAIGPAVTSGNTEALRAALGGHSMSGAVGLLAAAGLQHRERLTDANEKSQIDILRGEHGETVKIVGRAPEKDWFKEMEDTVDQALDPNGQIDDRLVTQAATALRPEGDRRPDDPEGAAAWRARRDALVQRLASQHYTWVGRAESPQAYPDVGLWATLQGEDGNQYWVDWGGNLQSATKHAQGDSEAVGDRAVIRGRRDDRRLTEEQRRGGVTDVRITPNPQGGNRTRLPDGQAPKTVGELLIDTLGRADELGRKYDTGVSVQAVVHDVVPDGSAAVHEWNGTISIDERYLDDIKKYLDTRALVAKHAEHGISPISDREHLDFYNALEILQHEINHGVGVNGGIDTKNYQGLGKNVEEGLTEETARLDVADWLRSYGMTDVLAAVKRNPDDWRVQGTYFDYRTQLKKLMDDAGLNDEQRRAKLRQMKFQMTPNQQYAEIIRLAQVKRPNVTDLGAALPSPGLPARLEFQPVVNPDLSDIREEVR